MAEPGLFKMIIEWRQKAITRFLPRGWRVSAHPNPGFDESTHEPRPDGPLMITAVPLDHPSLVPRAIARFARAETPQSLGSQKRAFDGLHHSARRLLFEQTQG
jgi:hypothetical protein